MQLFQVEKPFHHRLQGSYPLRSASSIQMFEAGCCTTGFSVTWLGQDPTFDPMTSPLGLLLLHDLLALLSPAFVDRVAWVVDLESVLVVHVGILDFSGLLIKLQNMGHPKSDTWREFKEQQQRITKSQLCRAKSSLSLL